MTAYQQLRAMRALLTEQGFKPIQHDQHVEIQYNTTWTRESERYGQEWVELSSATSESQYGGDEEEWAYFNAEFWLTRRRPFGRGLEQLKARLASL